MPILEKCGCFSLRTGTIVSGVLIIVLSLISFITVFAADVRLKTIVIDDLPPLANQIILSINLVIVIVASVLLIIGAIYKKIWYFLPWLILQILMIAGILISSTYTSINLFIDGNATIGTFSLLFGFGTAALYLCLWLVVFSYFQVLRAQKTEESAAGY